MDFFDSQDAARRRTYLLVLYYLLAVVVIVGGVYISVAFLALPVITVKNFFRENCTIVGKPELETWAFWDRGRAIWSTVLTLGVIIGGTIYRMRQLARGGEAVAWLLGGTPVSQTATKPGERRLLNVVEEMAIASGMPVPKVFILKGVKGLNAFAAGFTPSDAVIGVTDGCTELLTRDELQGAIAHEFSHIVNGDMRLNTRTVGLLFGISLVELLLHRTLLGPLIKFVAIMALFVVPMFFMGILFLLPALAVLLVVAPIFLVGAFGIFLARLIKSEISRQREFMADAYAVQFTRNPAGLAGALKKVGGYVFGGRVTSRFAEQASHLFFTDALPKRIIAWRAAATHPPLEDRIRTLDASFDGTFPEVRSHDATSVADIYKPGGLYKEPPPSAAVDAGEVLSSVGAPGPRHIAFAGALLAGLAPELTAQAHSPVAARAIVYGLLLNRDSQVRQKQLKRLKEHGDQSVLAETWRLMDLLAQAGPEARLPLARLAVAALRELPDDDVQRFWENFEHLVVADEEVDLFELALQRMIRRSLGAALGNVGPPAVRFRKIEAMLPQCTDLLSCLAYWGSYDMLAEQQAFEKGAAKLDAGTSLKIRAQADCNVALLDAALDVLCHASPQLKKHILDACVTCVSADGKVSVEESEVLQAVADSLDCPLPPILAGETDIVTGGQ